MILEEEYTKSRHERERDLSKKRSTQSKLNFLVPAYDKKQADLLFGKAIYTSVCSFTLFTSLEWRAFFKHFGYTPLAYTTLANSLLDTIYEEVKEDVMTMFWAAPYLGIVVDELENILGDRIENISVMCKKSSYFWSLESMLD